MINFLKEMIVGNVWLWAHIILGAILTLILRFYIIYSRDRIAYFIYAVRQLWDYPEKRQILVIVFAVALAWEIFEVYYWGIDGYSGGVMGWLADSIGDILGAFFAAILVMI